MVSRSYEEREKLLGSLNQLRSDLEQTGRHAECLNSRSPTLFGGGENSLMGLIDKIKEASDNCHKVSDALHRGVREQLKHGS